MAAIVATFGGVSFGIASYPDQPKSVADERERGCFLRDRDGGCLEQTQLTKAGANRS